MTDFEVLLISIDWKSPDRVRSVIASKKFLDASKINGNKYGYDIVMYHKEDNLYFQLAIKSELNPVIIQEENGQRNIVERFKQIDKGIWIIKREWDYGARGIGYHKCPSINTPGELKIALTKNFTSADYFLEININPPIEDFDFAELKNDFEGELWNLITSKKSLVTVDKIEFKYGDKTIRFPENKLIIDFLKEFDKISKNPKRELSHTKEFRRTEKVIPITETYRKFFTAGTATLLPSKAVIENHDIYENRFVCVMLHTIHSIVSKNIKYTFKQIERLKNEIETLRKKISILQDPAPKVNQIETLNLIKAQEHFYCEWKRKWEIKKNIFIENYSSEAQSFRTIKIHIVYQSTDSSYWVNIFNSQDESEYCLFEFSCDCNDIFEEQKGQFISISAFYYQPKGKDGVAGNFKKYFVKAIDSLTLITIVYESVIRKQKLNAHQLEVSGWKKLFTSSEIKEQKNQVQTLIKKIEKLNAQIKNIGEFNVEQSRLQPLIVQRLKTTFFKEIKWKNFQGFKPSMTFIQNIIYRNALRYYKEILKSERIDIAVFDLYENVTSFELREMPQVYELWCLVTQIKVLEESFHFEHEPKDLTALLKAIDPNKQTIAEHVKINFKKSLAGRKVTLHYQKTTFYNKRPDFILEFSGKLGTLNLILDSKFKNYNYKKSIVMETVDMKDKYGSSNDYVFILHPCKDGTFNNKIVKYTNHGGERMFYGDGEAEQIEFPFHKYGYIELKPNFTDTLKKLIAMGFEYLLEPSHNAKHGKLIDPKPENDMFCINCGKENLEMERIPRGDNRFHYSYTCKETDCGHNIYIDYCWNCKTKLIKHGSYWDYHLGSTWSIFDIRCPSCGMTVADKPQNTDY
jgi:uncharacterized protein (UPF0335 family)